MRCLTFYFSMLLLLGQGSLSAQNWEKARYGLLGLNIQNVNFGGFNEQSTILGYPALPGNLTEISGGWAVHDGRWRTAYTLSMAWSEEVSNETFYKSRYEQFQLGYSTSYNVVGSNAPWFVGPEINLQFQAAQVILSEKSEVRDLQGALQVEYLKLNRLGLYSDLGLIFQRGFGLNKAGAPLLVLGMRGGYRLGDDLGWRVTQAVNFKESGLRSGGWYASFNLGVSLQ